MSRSPENRQRPQMHGKVQVLTQRSTTTHPSSKAQYPRKKRLLDTNQRFKQHILRAQKKVLTTGDPYQNHSPFRERVCASAATVFEGISATGNILMHSSSHTMGQRFNTVLRKRRTLKPFSSVGIKSVRRRSRHLYQELF